MCPEAAARKPSASSGTASGSADSSSPPPDTLFGIVLILDCLIVLALAGFLPEQISQLVDDFSAELRTGLVRLSIAFLFLGLVFPFAFLYIASQIHKLQQSKIEALEERQKLPKQAKIIVDKIISPHIPPHSKVGITIENNEIQDLTDIQIKLVRATQFEFSDETGYMEDTNWVIEPDNSYFDLGTNNKVGANNKEVFYLAEIQDKQVVFLLKKKHRPVSYHHPHIQAGVKTHHVYCQFEFEVYGKISGEAIRKERYSATVNSFRVIPIYDDSFGDTISIDMPKEVIYIPQEGTKE